MCGIAGFISPDRRLNTDQLGRIARTMADRLTHRGPDDSGSWCEVTSGLALGHRRLSIVDLSRHGHQPMLSPDGRYVLVLNGETVRHQYRGRVNCRVAFYINTV